MGTATDGEELGHLRYALGFIVGCKADKVPKHFVRVPFPVELHIHPRTRFGIAHSPACTVALLGEAVHPEHPEFDTQQLAALISARYDARQDVVDKLVGRFAVIWGAGPKDMWLQTDAIGMRAVFYSAGTGGAIAGSHAKLVAETATVGGDAVSAAKPFKLGYPGLTTPFPGVSRVPPNVELSLHSGILRRFFPVEPVPTVSIETAWEVAFSRAQAAISAFSRRRRLLVSLTAGLDTRTTLAALRGSFPQLSFFTYNGGVPSHLIDTRVAADIAARFGLRHECLDYSAYQPDPRMLSVLKDNSFTNHGPRLACAYLQRFGTGNWLHVRTNLLELGRSNLFAANDGAPGLHGGPSTAERMAKFYVKVARLERHAHVLPAFERYVASTDFASAARLASPWDLYFVEHRMGAWHAGILLESDIAFDTIIAFNSREVVRHLMGIPQDVRATSPHLLSKLASMLPELSAIPINPDVYPLAAEQAPLPGRD